MKDTEGTQEAVEAQKGDTHKQEDKMEEQQQKEDKHSVPPPLQPSSVHFFPKVTDSDATALSLPQSLSYEMPLNAYQSTSLQSSTITIPTTGMLTSKSTIASCTRAETSLGSSHFFVPKNQSQLGLDAETLVFGEGEDYFLSLFGDSKKLTSHSSHEQETCRHLSTILEEVGQSTSSALGDIKITEVHIKGLFVKLVNSSLDKEVEIGDHTLQQNVNGQAISLYRFLPNIIMQASSTVTVWAAVPEAKHQPPSDFLWKEQNRFRSSPDCTTILCKPNGEAVAWYTPIHWKQAWEKLETDIEFNRCSVVTSTFRSHMFQWTTSVTSVNKENQDQLKTDASKCQVEQSQLFLNREKEIPPTLFPTRSPWCHSPYVPAHPYCPLIEPYKTYTTESSSGRQPRSQSTKPHPATGTKKKMKSKLQKK